jgi:hypothetical protein
LDLCNKWEQWEPEDKSRKNPVRTLWRDEVEKGDIGEENPVDEWWEAENMGYTEESDDKPKFYWNNKIRK